MFVWGVVIAREQSDRGNPKNSPLGRGGGEADGVEIYLMRRGHCSRYFYSLYFVSYSDCQMHRVIAAG